MFLYVHMPIKLPKKKKNPTTNNDGTTFMVRIIGKRVDTSYQIKTFKI